MRGIAIAGGALVAIIAGAFALGGARSAGMTALEAASFCAKDGAGLADYLAAAERRGAIDHPIGAHYQVDESAWSALAHDLKIQLAFAAFCRSAGGTGHATVLLYGRRDGQVKASVVDGNYSD